MNEVIKFPHRKMVAGGRVILRHVDTGWALHWAASETAEPWCFAAIALSDPARVAARAIASHFGCELVVEEGVVAS